MVQSDTPPFISATSGVIRGPSNPVLCCNTFWKALASGKSMFANEMLQVMQVPEVVEQSFQFD